MDERSQGTIEYLLMLAAALVVVASVTYMLFSTSIGLGGDVEDRIENVRENVIRILT